MVDELEGMKIIIQEITETKKNLKGAESPGRFMMNYSGVPAKQRAEKGVGLIVDNMWSRKTESHAYVSDRIIMAVIHIPKRQLVVVGVYAPEEGKKEETLAFYEQLQQEINKYRDKQLILADVNVRVGIQPIPNIVETSSL